MIVNICGVPHKVIECENALDGSIQGEITYKDCTIKINKDMSDYEKKETLCHEMVHGIFVHLGYNDHADNEQLVQALGNAIYQGFTVKEYKDNEMCIKF